MPGPFPGMDPFLENTSSDVHTSLMVYAANLLRPSLPSGFRARIEEREDDFIKLSDLDDPISERTVYLHESFYGRVVTSIEFLSPHIKLTERARGQFRRKQVLLLSAGVNLVEIDLVRQGGWALSFREPATRQS